MTSTEPHSGDADSDAVKADADAAVEAESELVESGGVREATEPEAKSSDNRQTAHRRLSVSVRTLVIAVTVVALAVAAGAFGWLYLSAQNDLDAQARTTENHARAEKVALDYAVNAAEMNYRDLDGWKVKLVAGTSPELKERLTKAAIEMEQILVPLEWTSTAKPLVAKVRSGVDGVYIVDSFVSVFTKTVQAAEPLQSTATYSVTIDSNQQWQITDVGGIGAVVGDR